MIDIPEALPWIAAWISLTLLTWALWPRGKEVPVNDIDPQAVRIYCALLVNAVMWSAWALWRVMA